METSEGAFAMSEFEREKKAEVAVLTETGLGYGEGGISPNAHMKEGKFDEASYEAAIDILMNDDDVFVPVDEEANDDGCGDGRNTVKIYKLLDPLTGKVETFKRSLRRAKLFGGGLVAASSMWRAVDGSPAGKTLRGDREFIASKLKARGISYGAHIDDHASGEACGCGAIDKYDVISQNVVKYRSAIIDSLAVLYGDAFDDNADAIASVMSVYNELNDEYYAGLTGEEAMKDIEKDGAVVKQLGGTHMEGVVVINKKDGTTLDQDMLREKLIERGHSPNVQAFVVDEWRGRMYAEVIADLAEDEGKDRDEAFKTAYADFLIRTLGVSATLTAGDLPVIVRQEQKDYALTA